MLQPHCVTLESILDGRCGVVPGEAGIGKSDALREIERIPQGRTRGPVLKLDLGEYGDTSELAADVPVFVTNLG